MTQTFRIARITFQEAIRDRVLAGFAGFAALFILLDIFLANIAFGDLVVVKSFGLSSMYIFGLIAAIALGANIMSKEFDKRTLSIVLSKPVTRREIIRGKYAGFTAALSLLTLAMTGMYLGVMLIHTGALDVPGLFAAFFQIMETALLASLMIFLSSVVRPLSATVSAAGIAFAGHAIDTALANAAGAGRSVRALVSMFYFLLPNLEKFNLRGLAAHGIAPSWEAAAFAFGYATLYAAILLYGAQTVFERKEL